MYTNNMAFYQDLENIPLEKIKYYDRNNAENTTYFIRRIENDGRHEGVLGEIEDIVVHLRYHDSKNVFDRSKRGTFSLKYNKIHEAIKTENIDPTIGGKKRNLKTKKKNMRRRIRKTKRRSWPF